MFLGYTIFEFLSFLSLVINIVLFVAVGLLLFNLSKLGRLGAEASKADKRSRTHIAKKIEEQAEEKLDAIISAVGKKLQEEIVKKVDGMASEASNSMQGVAKHIEEQQDSVLRESQLVVAKIINDARVEVETYKKKEMEKAGKMVYEMVTEAAKQVIGKTINPGEHQALVEKALDRAKRDKFFS